MIFEANFRRVRFLLYKNIGFIPSLNKTQNFESSGLGVMNFCSTLVPVVQVYVRSKLKEEYNIKTIKFITLLKPYSYYFMISNAKSQTVNSTYDIKLFFLTRQISSFTF